MRYAPGSSDTPNGNRCPSRGSVNFGHRLSERDQDRLVTALNRILADLRG